MLLLEVLKENQQGRNLIFRRFTRSKSMRILGRSRRVVRGNSRPSSWGPLVRVRRSKV